MRLASGSTTHNNHHCLVSPGPSKCFSFLIVTRIQIQISLPFRHNTVYALIITRLYFHEFCKVVGLCEMHPCEYISELCNIYSTVGRSIADISDPRRHIYWDAKHRGKYAAEVWYRGYRPTYCAIAKFTDEQYTTINQLTVSRCNMQELAVGLHRS